MIRLRMHTIFAFFILLLAEVQAGTPNSEFVNGDVQTDDKLTQMLQVSGVQPIYEKCKANPGSGSISDCVWTGIQADDTLKKKVLEEYKNLSTAKDSKGTNKSPVKEVFSTDPALQKLGEVIWDKLQEALYGTEKTNDPNKIVAVDQKRFNDIYRTELSKTMVDAFMSYCLDTVGTQIPKDKALAEQAFKANREANIKGLRDDAKNFLDTKDSSGNNKWNGCIAKIQDHCLGKGVEEPQQSRACLVTQYVESGRKNISVLDQTDKVYGEMKGGPIMRDTNFKERDLKSLAVLTTITSKDIETAYRPSEQTIKDDLKECEKNNEEKCKNFLSSNKKENEDGLVEFTLRQNADAENFKEKVNQLKSPDELKQFLLDRGYKQETVDKMDLSDPQKVKDVISQRYSEEKKALIEEMNKRINDKTADDDKASPKNQDKLQKISEELNARTDNMKNLVMFNNVVSGYLDVQVGTGKEAKADRNTASLAAELNNNDDKVIAKIKTDLEKDGEKIENPNDSKDSGTETSSLDTDRVLAPADFKPESK